MHDRREKLHELHKIARARSAGANINIGSRELVNLVPANVAVSASDAGPVVVIDKRALFRECVMRCLQASSGHTVVSFPNVDSWLDVCNDISASVILLCLVGRPGDAETHREISRLSQQGDQPPAIILSDVEDPDQIVDAIGRGARGYIPTSAPLEVVIEVMRLVRAGGVFVPASSLIAARRLKDCITVPHQKGNALLTARQAAVVEALRRGKANKVIASELNMCESTVKVHIRNIMRKLKARNRTEVAVMANELMRNGGAV